MFQGGVLHADGDRGHRRVGQREDVFDNGGIRVRDDYVISGQKAARVSAPTTIYSAGTRASSKDISP